MIRSATVDDIDEIVVWGRRFHDVSPFAGRVSFDMEDLKTSLRAIIEGDGAVFINGHGICGGIIVPLYFNHNFRVSTELFWFAEKGGRGLRRAFHAWAEENGATAHQMTCLADGNEQRMRKHYERLGFSPMEVSFFKEV